LVQHSGAGSLLLRAAESKLTTRRVTHLWANGRDTALGFYDKCGWTRVAGSEHLSKETGLPHTVITRALVDPRAVRLDWATQRDVHACASLREEMYFALNWRDFGTDWIVESARHFADGITNNLLVAAVARTDDGEVVALAAAALREAPPLPRHPLGRVAYVHSVSVRPRFRHRGLARQLMTMLVEELDARAIERVELHATDFGYEIYEQMGFVIRTHSPEMRLNLREILFD